MGLATPSDPFCDPYIAVSMITLAKEQAKLALEESPETEFPSTHKFPLTPLWVRVFMISPHDPDAMRLYAADIPAAFLKAINDPSIPLDEPLRIKARAFPHHPYGTLSTRLWDEVQPLPPAERAERAQRERVIRSYEAEEKRLSDERWKEIRAEMAEMEAKEKQAKRQKSEAATDS